MTTLTHLDLDGVHALSWGGGGSPVVLVHGLDGSAANWIGVGQELASEHRVLALDLPGFGRTPLGRHRSGMTAHADLVARVTRAWLGTDEPVAIAGNSMGGVVTALAAARHPGLARKVTLVASAVPRAGSARIDASMLPAAASLWLPGAGTAIAGARNATPPQERVRSLLELCVPPGVVGSLPQEAVAEMVAVAEQRDRRDHVRAWGRSARSLWGWLARRGAFHAEVDRIDAEGLLLSGALDPIIPTSSSAAFADRHPGWAWTALDGVGHVPPLEAPQATAAALR